ncbi:ABC transporter ATP-binding protein [Chitinimonas lacunae]|uniref:ABC transporter ATP-binding protein n=1 Tax=Chitinimonas lacunae TaxID=1963018 RepID=A0ABV8MUB0_9NEIS
MAIAIKIQDIRKTYRDARLKRSEVLKGISFEVEEGEAFGFIGPNGAGKSSTIKILVGVSRPTSGEAEIFGRPIAEHASRIGMGYVPESPYLNDYLTPYEVLSAGIALHKLKVPDVRRYCLEWLERFRIAHVADKKIRSFSKGMVQRTALAHALAVKPRLLILDEPLSGLDPIGRRETVDILHEYHSQGGTLFFSSHVLHDVERLAQRFGFIHKGLIKTVQTPAELLNKHGNYSVFFCCTGQIGIEGAVRLDSSNWCVEVSTAALWDTLQRLRECGAELREVRPMISLEKAFLEFIGEDIKTVAV